MTSCCHCQKQRYRSGLSCYVVCFNKSLALPECKDGAEPGGGEFSASMDSSAKEHLIMKGMRLALDAVSLQ